MSAGGVFRLLTNDGKADRIILATELINNRIEQIKDSRMARGLENIMPTLGDIEKTHVLFVNAHFKPHIAIGSEYNKVNSQSGTAAFGQSVTFSIPQFGDFFHDMVVYTRINGFSAKTLTSPAQGTAAFPTNGDYFVYKIVDPVGRLLSAVHPNGQADVAPATFTYRNFVRYCEYPGDRLFSKVQFDVNGNPLDEYTDIVPTFINKFGTPPNKRVARDRLTGQEVAMSGYGGLRYGVVTDADANTPANVIGKQNQDQSNNTVGLYAAAPVVGANPFGGLTGNDSLVNQTALVNLGASANQIDVTRPLISMVNGPQTPKPVQPPLDLWTKLCFWFNDDVKLAVPSIAIPFGMRYITLTLAPQASLMFEEPSLYLERTSLTHVGPPANPDHGKPPGYLRKTYTPIIATGGIDPVAIAKMELYINNIFVNPEIHDIYIKRIGFSLIRVHRQHVVSLNTATSTEQLLSNLKWPIEYMYVGLRPAFNTSDTNRNQWRDWHRMTKMVTATADLPDLAEDHYTYAGGPPQTVNGAMGSSIGKVQPDTYYLQVPTINSMMLKTHGVPVYAQAPDTFYGSYLPYHYGGAAITTSDDLGAMFVNFAMYPGAYQPSGHLNLSRSRETYLTIWSSTMTSASSHFLIVDARAINFLLISDGSAVLRYTT